MRWRRFQRLGLIITLVILPLLGFARRSHAQTVSIDATVQLSVCGNNVIEGVEDCEGTDLNSQTCVGQGYASGTLDCNTDCSFDYSACVATDSTSTDISASNDGSDDDDDDDEDSGSGSSDRRSSLRRIPVVSTIADFVATLPGRVSNFDLNSDGSITSGEAFGVVRRWGDALRNADQEQEIRSCDINADTRCNLVDLSILLYYVDRD